MKTVWYKPSKERKLPLRICEVVLEEMNLKTSIIPLDKVDELLLKNAAALSATIDLMLLKSKNYG